MSEAQQLPLQYQVRGSEERRRVINVLNQIRPRVGRDAALSMHTIAVNTKLSTRLIQAIVKFLVEEKHLPIGTAAQQPFGYFWIATMEERRIVRNHFVRRALSNLEHARAFDSQSIVGKLLDQIEIDFPEITSPPRQSR
jgi:hypothetical protein